MNNDFLSTSEAIRQWFSRVTKSRVKIIAESPHEWQKKSFLTVTNVLFYFLHVIFYHEHTNPLRTIIERLFRHCCQGRPFLTEHCDVTTNDLWRHANAKYWYCDVIFVYFHCTRKLAERRSSLVNNSREYRYLATRYSRLSVHDDVIKWKHFPRNWPFVRGIHRSRWIPHTKASDAELWCFLWSTPE